MFRVPARFWKVCVGALYKGILVAMPELLGESEVAVVVVLFNFDSALGAVGIVLKNAGSQDEPPETKTILPAALRLRVCEAVRAPAALRWI